MIEAFKSANIPKTGMSHPREEINAALSYLSTQESYAAMGRTALAVLAPSEQRLTLPFEVVGQVQHPSIVQAPHSIIFDASLIERAIATPFHYDGKEYQIRVAPVPDLTAIALVDNLRFGRDASTLFELLKLEQFEEVRILIKGPNYGKLFPKVTGALYDRVLSTLR